jgi:hypothetical protein
MKNDPIMPGCLLEVVAMVIITIKDSTMEINFEENKWTERGQESQTIN